MWYAYIMHAVCGGVKERLKSDYVLQYHHRCQVAFELRRKELFQ